MSDAIQQFRITIWPNAELPHPLLSQAPYLLRQERLGTARRVAGRVAAAARVFAASDAERAELSEWVTEAERRAGLRDRSAVAKSGEIYLELETLDLDDPEQILLFANRFGILGIASDDCQRVRDLPWYAEQVPPTEDDPELTVNPYIGGTTRVARAESLEAFRFAARILRDLRAAADILRNDPTGAMTWQSTPIPPPPHAGAQPLPGGAFVVTTADDPTRALSLFVEHTLTAALTPFHPRITITQPVERPEHGWLAGATISLFATCCVELHNHLVEHATYRRCQNDTCTQLFVRQTGRAEAGQHRRSGVKYCSSHCARAQAQRQYRRRLKGTSV